VDSDGSLPTHELDPLALLALARAWDCLPPRVLVVGCEAGSVAEGLGMTDSVAGAVDAAVQMVARVARGEAERLLREGSESR
jgi:hydrogenase maturation protease